MTILVPRGAEAAAVRRARTDHRVAAIAPGQAAAAELPSFERDEIVVVLGLCGGLHGRRTGDVVAYRGVAASQSTFPLETALMESLIARLAASGTRATAVTACTTDHVVTTRAERRALAERYGADVVDMESTRLVEALAAGGVRFAMVRVVSDDAARDLPALEGAIRSDGRIDGVRIALAFARDPIGGCRFVRDVRKGLTTLTTVTRALAG